MSAETEQRKLAAIMFIDMVGYSALSQRDDKLALELFGELKQRNVYKVALAYAVAGDTGRAPKRDQRANFRAVMPTSAHLNLTADWSV
jgi:hypothetical protein